MKIEIIDDADINNLYVNIKELVVQSRNRVYKTVNVEMIVEKQEGNIRAKYGDHLIENTSKKLTDEFGKGFSTRNLKRMRKLYLYYPKRATLLS